MAKLAIIPGAPHNSRCTIPGTASGPKLSLSRSTHDVVQVSPVAPPKLTANVPPLPAC